jgi:hypothetical protein
MSAIRLPLLCAFAGGCLSNLVVFGLWRAAEGPRDSAATEQHRSHHVVELATAASATPSVAQPSELGAASAGDHRHDAAIEAAPTAAASDLDNAGPVPAGSAVSDVLTRLEAAYREGVAARGPAQASSTQERISAAAPTDTAVASAEAAPGVPPQPVAEIVPAVPAATVSEPRAPAPAALAPAALAPQVSAVPAVAAQDTPPPPRPDVYYGDINQNTYITNVREGDTYLIQMQQIAILQYMQLLGMSPGSAAPARHVGGAGHQRFALSSGIVNPDNPWGFHFAPPQLVH